MQIPKIDLWPSKPRMKTTKHWWPNVIFSDFLIKGLVEAWHMYVELLKFALFCTFLGTHSGKALTALQLGENFGFCSPPGYRMSYSASELVVFWQEIGFENGHWSEVQIPSFGPYRKFSNRLTLKLFEAEKTVILLEVSVYWKHQSIFSGQDLL